MQGRLENQLKDEKRIREMLKDLPRDVNAYYFNFSSNKEFRSCLKYISIIRNFLIWYSNMNDVELKKINFKDITDIDIANYLKERETKETDNGKEYTSFSYRRLIWASLNSYFGFLYKKRIINSNPVQLIEKSNKKDKVDHVYLQKEDLDEMINYIQNIIDESKEKRNKTYLWKMRDLSILYMFIFTGMRESALCEIDLDKVDFDNNMITVIDKGHKKNTYTISVKLREILLQWLACRKELLGDTECDSLFISSRKQRMNRESIRVLVKKYSEEALGKSVSPHRLRAAYGNIIYKKTKDIEFTRASMKHTNISTTRIYIEDNEQDINNKVANIMDDLF